MLPHSSQKSVLIVEDSPTQSERLKILLENRGFEILTARNGEEALRLLARLPSVVVTDVMMPLMDGYELCRRIKQDESRKDISVILLTALSDPQDVMNGLSCGADNFITKPYSDEVLVSRIETALQNKDDRRVRMTDSGFEISFAGKKHHITANRVQIIDMLLSTYENAIQKAQELDRANRELARAQRELQSLNQRQQRSLVRLELLSSTAGDLLRSEEPLSIIDSLCRKVMDHLGCHMYLNFLVDEEVGRLRLNAYGGITEKEADRVRWLDYGESVGGCVAQQGSHAVVERVGDSTDSRTEVIRSFGVTAYACNPLMVEGGKVIGTLAFGSKSREAFSEDELSFIKAISDQVSVALARMRSQQSLKESEERFRTLADNISQFTWIADRDGAILWYNKRWYDYTGTNLDEVKGWGWEKLLHPEHLMRVRDSWTAALQAGESWEDTYLLRGRKGEYRWFLSRALPIRDGAGAIVKWFGTDTDITEQRRTEETLRNKTEELAALNKEIESFSYSVSHDLRAPLRTMAGFSRFLLEDYAQALDETGRDYLEQIITGAKKMNDLIDDMLNLSRVSRQEMRGQDIDLSDVARTVVLELQHADPNRKVSVKIHPHLRVHGDARLLTMALSNLIGNAWKYTGKREEPYIEIGSYVHNGGVVFFVKDNGAGFSSKQGHRLFTPFQRLHSQSEFPGTGVGLAIVQRVIARHGGKVWAEGEMGQGATFYFTIPG